MKKTLSVILAVIMTLSVFSVCAFAAPSPIAVSGVALVRAPYQYKIDAAKYSVSVDVSSSRLVAESGKAATDLVACATTSYVLDNSETKVYYETDAQTFADTFNTYSELELGLEIIGDLAEVAACKYIRVPYTFTVDSDAFGFVDYTITVNGLYHGDLTEDTEYVTASAKGSELVQEAEVTLSDVDVDTTYTDKDTLKLNAATASVVTANGVAFGFTYATNPNMFEINPDCGDILTVNATEAIVGVIAQNNDANVATPITVNHAWSTGYVSLGKSSHAKVCEGCGEVDSTTVCDHVFNDDDYTYNDDATFFADGTETCKCADCDETNTRIVDGTAGYVEKFGDYEFLYVIFDYISLIFDFIRGGKIF